MKVLYVTRRSPWPASCGGDVRVRGTAEALASRGHEVELLCYHEPGRVLGKIMAGISVSSVSGRPVGKPSLVLALSRGGAPISTSFFSRGMETALRARMNEGVAILFDGLDPLCCATVEQQRVSFVDLVDEVSERYLQRAFRTSSSWRRMVLRFHAWSLRQAQRGVCQRVRGAFICSETDRLRLAGFADVSTVRVLPTAVDPRFFNAQPSRTGGSTVLFVGALGYEPNDTGLQHFCRFVLPPLVEHCPELTFRVVGRGPVPAWLQRKADEWDFISLHPDVSDVLPYYEESDLCVIPMITGTGVPTKILEGLAVGLPIVATREAVAGLPASLLSCMEVTSDPEEMVRTIAASLHAGPSQMEIEGRKAAVAAYASADRIADVLEEALWAVEP